MWLKGAIDEWILVLQKQWYHLPWYGYPISIVLAVLAVVLLFVIIVAFEEVTTTLMAVEFYILLYDIYSIVMVAGAGESVVGLLVLGGAMIALLVVEVFCRYCENEMENPFSLFLGGVLHGTWNMGVVCISCILLFIPFLFLGIHHVEQSDRYR